MEQRWLDISPEADENQETKFQAWAAAEGIEFRDEAARDLYRHRVGLFKAAIRMKVPPERIPVCPSAGFFPIQYAGLNFQQAMYDYDALARAWAKYAADFDPDAYNSPFVIVPGPMLEELGVNFYRWPGNGVGEDQEYQYVEKEYMRPDEYQDLIDDPTGFFLNRFLPRVFGALKAFETMPLWPGVNEIPCIPPGVIPFGLPDMQQALNSLMSAGEKALEWITAVRRINQVGMADGHPSFSGGFTKAPFDVIGDTLRGTRGVMMDMFRKPELLIEACERLTPLMIRAGVDSCRASGHLMPFIPLHKGADGFMSDEQFKTFYWPSLRKLIIGLIDAGLVPLLFAEGAYNQRLEAICDLPKGRTMWWFDATDMDRAKQTIGQVSCIAGNVPVALLATGNKAGVEDYCAKLIKTAGKGGGFVFSTGAGMQGAKPENVKAMMEVAKKYA